MQIRELMQQEPSRLTQFDRALIAAITKLAQQNNRKPEEVYEALLREYAVNLSRGPIGQENANGLEGVLQHILHRLTKLEEHMSSQDAALKRVADAQTALEGKLTDQQTALSTFAQQLLAAQQRMQADIDAIRQSSGSGNADAINAVADRMDKTLATVQSITDAMNAAAAAESQVDVLTISPSTASLAPGAQQQFNSNDVGATFKSNPSIGGSIDKTGLYTAPSTGGVSDTITATSADGTQTATASVSVSA